MSRDMEYIELGPTPAEEPCAQVGQADFLPKNLEEVHRYLRQLKRMHPVLPEGCKFDVHVEHGEGYTSREACIRYPLPASPEVRAFLEKVQDGLPAYWDGEYQSDAALALDRAKAAVDAAASMYDQCQTQVCSKTEEGSKLRAAIERLNDAIDNLKVAKVIIGGSDSTEGGAW